MKKLFLLLNLFAASHFIIHHANSAQPDGGQPAAPKEVPSLQNLCLKMILKKYPASIPPIILEHNYLKCPINIFITQHVAAIATNMINDNQARSAKNSPLTKFKTQFPLLAAQLDNGTLQYNLSIQDLIDAGADLTKTYNSQDNSLSLSYLSLTSLHGLQNVPHKDLIQQINLNNNLLTHIPSGTFNNLPALIFLYLNKNKIATIPSDAFNNLRALKKLYLDNNQITTIPSNAFNNLIELEWLYLNNNKIDAIPSDAFNNLRALKELYLDNNQITTIPSNAFNNLIELGWLYLNNNKIDAIPSDTFNNLIELGWLQLNNNHIKNITADTFNRLAQLNVLHLNDNRLSDEEKEEFKSTLRITLDICKL